MTPLQLDPSAQAPWTRTMFGRPFIVALLSPVSSTASLARQRRARIARSCDSKARGRMLGGGADVDIHAEFHGREAELALSRRELERLAGWNEAAVVVEGAAGMGKSRLLAEVAAIARSLGIRVGSSAADPSETWSSSRPCSLRCWMDEPLLDPPQLASLHARPEQRFWLCATCSADPASGAGVAASDRNRGRSTGGQRNRRGDSRWRCGYGRCPSPG